jgi:four helix bundle protein
MTHYIIECNKTNLESMKFEDLEKNAILKHSFEFSLAIIQYCTALQEIRQFVISNQLLKSGTSIGANCMEAQNSESKADFIHKFKIAAKEAEETQYWLWLCKKSIGFPECEALLSKLDNINRLLNAIISSAKPKKT